MPVKMPPNKRGSKKFEFSNCPHCHNDFLIIFNHIANIIDINGNLRINIVDFPEYIQQAGSCNSCNNITNFEFSINLTCNGAFKSEWHQPDWLLWDWACYQVKDEKKDLVMEQENLSSNEDIIETEEFPVIRPGWSLEKWFERQSSEDKKKFIDTTKISHEQLHEVFRGKSSIDRDFAIKLSNSFGKFAEFWLWMQCHYDTAKSKNRRAHDDELPSLFPQ